MNAMRALLVAMMVLFAGPTFPAKAQDSAASAPFGLSWGSSSGEVEALGVLLAKIDLADFGSSFAATNLPKTLSDVETVVLSFGYDDKLWRVAAISRTFERDGYGGAVRARYDELKATLANLYGSPKEAEYMSSDKYYSKPDNFIYGIYSHENQWFTDFNTKALDIQLGIGASGPSDAFWRLIYTDKAGEVSFHQQHKNVESNAL